MAWFPRSCRVVMVATCAIYISLALRDIMEINCFCWWNEQGAYVIACSLDDPSSRETWTLLEGCALASDLMAWSIQKLFDASWFSMSHYLFSLEVLWLYRSFCLVFFCLGGFCGVFLDGNTWTQSLVFYIRNALSIEIAWCSFKS